MNPAQQAKTKLTQALTLLTLTIAMAMPAQALGWTDEMNNVNSTWYSIQAAANPANGFSAYTSCEGGTSNDRYMQVLMNGTTVNGSSPLKATTLVIRQRVDLLQLSNVINVDFDYAYNHRDPLNVMERVVNVYGYTTSNMLAAKITLSAISDNDPLNWTCDRSTWKHYNDTANFGNTQVSYVVVEIQSTLLTNTINGDPTTTWDFKLDNLTIPEGTYGSPGYLVSI